MMVLAVIVEVGGQLEIRMIRATNFQIPINLAKDKVINVWEKYNKKPSKT